MASKPSRPALDAWLAEADRVLAEARSASLSPSTYPAPWNPHRTEQDMTLGELGAQLEAVLSRLAFGPGRWILIVEDKDARYVQVLAYEDGSVYAETVSNHYLKSEQRWSEHDEAKLKGLGWRAPEGKKLNWHATFPTISPDTGEIAGLMMATLQGVFRLKSVGWVKLVMFASALRGNTPASRVAKPRQTRRRANSLRDENGTGK